ncbi:patatin-like phospholipase family protein [Anoxynatronum sibiricum]|uniref:Patatin-like phospholipase family protein n=1 Tax=Anoxynatronum sibiricum TaxID=210623 RepID=A0ABU9VWE8_9CLOT
MLGLTLEGGGAKGAYQIGAWKAFREMGVTFQGITGTSVGALNGGLMAQDDFEAAWELWYHMTPQQVMTLDDDIYEMLSDRKLDHTNVMTLIEEIRNIIKNSGIDTSPLYDMIQQLLSEEAIRRSPVDFGFVTFSITDRKPLELFKEDIPEGKIADYLMASSYLPVFKERLLDGKLFLDGGFYNNLPANMLVRKGYREIYAVRLYGSGRIIRVNEKDATIHYIAPERDLGGMLDFSTQRSRRNLTLGYLDTLRVLKKYQGKRFYLKTFPDEMTALQMILRWPEEAKKEVCTILGLKPGKALNRLFIEDAIPALMELAGLTPSHTHRDLLMRVLEATAETCQVDYLKVYAFDEWMQVIANCPFHQQQKNEANSLASFLRISENLFKPGREKKKEALLQSFMKNRDWFRHMLQG